MDQNKRKKLKEIGYEVSPHCGICKSAFFTRVDSSWGSCTKFRYNHLKHTADSHELSITRVGLCPSFFKDDKKLYKLHGFKEFINEKTDQTKT